LLSDLWTAELWDKTFVFSMPPVGQAALRNWGACLDSTFTLSYDSPKQP
jgi:hypothetical protein